MDNFNYKYCKTCRFYGYDHIVLDHDGYGRCRVPVMHLNYDNDSNAFYEENHRCPCNLLWVKAGEEEIKIDGRE